jgi:tripartite-type tricarboxylate transporter receptor subunit TctC
VAARSLRTLLAWFALPAICFAGGLASSATTSFAQTQTYPDRPVRLLVPLAAASAVDVVARLMSEKMGDSLGQRFYVENQPGAAGLLGMRAGARAAPDGQ